jgi:hypothetical protein
MPSLQRMLAAALGAAVGVPAGRHMSASKSTGAEQKAGPQPDSVEEYGCPPPPGVLALLTVTLAPKQWPVLAILRYSRSDRDCPRLASTCSDCRTRS